MYFMYSVVDTKLAFCNVKLIRVGVKTSNFWRSNFFSLKCKIDQEIERGLRG